MLFSWILITAIVKLKLESAKDYGRLLSIKMIPKLSAAAGCKIGREIILSPLKNNFYSEITNLTTSLLFAL